MLSEVANETHEKQSQQLRDAAEELRGVLNRLYLLINANGKTCEPITTVHLDQVRNAAAAYNVRLDGLLAYEKLLQRDFSNAMRTAPAANLLRQAGVISNTRGPIARVADKLLEAVELFTEVVKQEGEPDNGSE